MKTTKNDPKLDRYFGSTELIIPWLEILNLFQTFTELDEVKDKPAEVRAVRELLDETDGEEVASC